MLGRGFWVVVSTVLIGMLGSTVGTPVVADSTPSPLAIACGMDGQSPDLVPEVRQAGATALSMTLSRQLRELLPKEMRQGAWPISRAVPLMFRSAPLDREGLHALSEDLADYIDRVERIARGPNPECRGAASGFLTTHSDDTLSWVLDLHPETEWSPYFADLRVSPLHDAYVLKTMADALLTVDSRPPRGNFPTEELYDQLSDLVASARNAETFALAVTRSLVPVVIAFEQLDRGSPAHFPDGFRDELLDLGLWKRAACGEQVALDSLGLTLDGSMETGGNPDYRYPFRVAGAFGWFRAAFALRFDGPTSSEIMDVAQHGCSPELRSYAARMLPPTVDIRRDDPSVRERARQQLRQLIADPQSSTEMRDLARTKLAWLTYASGRTDEQLESQIVSANSVDLRWMASQALAMRWAEQVLDNELHLDASLTIGGPDGATAVSGTLTQIAYESTVIDPVLARAPIDALALLYLENADLPPF